MDSKVRFVVDTGFTKAAETPRGDLKLLGYASTWTLDRDNEVVDPKAFDKSLSGYLSANPILLWQHDLERPIGTVEAAALDKHGLNVRANVPKPSEKEPDWAHLAYNKIKSGIVKTFSIGGAFEKQSKGGKKIISHVDLYEISVVSVPSNPDTIFAAAVKALSGPQRPELLVTHVSQMKQLLGMEAISDPELAEMKDAERKERYAEIAGIYRKVGKLPPGYDSFRELAKEVTEYRGQKGALDRANRVAALIQRVQGYAPDPEMVKAGRVLSKTNEARLRNAFAAIKEVLDLIDSQPDEEEEEEASPPATALERG